MRFWNLHIASMSIKQISLWLFVTLTLFHTVRTSSLHFHLYGFIFAIAMLVLVQLCNPIKKNTLISLGFVCLIFASYIKYALGTTSQIKYIFYLLPLCFIPFNYTRYDLYYVTSKVFYIYSLFSIVLFFVGIGVESGYGISRLQGLLSEPSAFSLLAVFNFLNFLYLRKLKYLFVAVLLAFLVKSLMLLVCLFASVFIYLALMKGSFFRVSLFIIFIFSCFGMYEFLVFLNGVYDNVLLSRLVSGLQYIVTWGELGHNPRFYTVIAISDYYKDNFLFGKGFNAAEFYVNDTGNLRDFNIWFEMFASFGLIGALSIFILLIFLLLTGPIFSKEKYTSVMFVSYLVYCSLNSAQGIVFQQMFLCVFVMIILGGNNDKSSSFYNNRNL